MGPCSHLTRFGSRMISGSAKRLYRNGSTSSCRSGPPRFRSNTPNFSSCPVLNAFEAGVRASPVFFDLPQAQLFPTATIRVLVRPRPSPSPPPTRFASAARLCPRLLTLLGAKGATAAVELRVNWCVGATPKNQARATTSEHSSVNADALILCCFMVLLIRVQFLCPPLLLPSWRVRQRPSRTYEFAIIFLTFRVFSYSPFTLVDARCR